ncbi:DUF1501 domain-containing protein [Urbifossiella limnaea]|uniref:DUF1501 domain-containing protein n=1 Tax=Urbifossiella limnaea TaxID=2528023 RepID=A0A517XPG8_9BACT|nr:DUF1501 domain-containing protein [Urbifossiella limnaea]QDU19382.1 hypothetical protein ETAA1_13060 [Urbifossiella limnaea]
MFEVGSFPSALHGGVSRRAFLAASAAVPFAGTAAATPGRARSVIVLWLWGAPSHIDTFDPKPNAPAEVRGPFGTIPTRTAGVRVTELFPKTAARSDRFALVRSNVNFDGDHLKAGSIGLTGVLEGKDGAAPNFGSVVARHRGGGDLPAFVALGRGNPRDVVGPMKGFGGGTWGRNYDPFLVGCTPAGETDIPALRLLDGLSPAALDDRRRLLAELDRVARTGDAAAPGRWDAATRRAYALLTTPDARAALDLSRERGSTRDAYGHTSFGQSCLLARRLAEAGVPYIQVNWSQYVEAMTPNCDFGWDTHVFNFDLLPDRHGPVFDRAYAALLDDLRDRGMLDSTLVLAMGEFGRTPRVNGQASRDHWPQCYFSLWAGCGVRGGTVVGDSDRTGAAPLTEPITPGMVGATVLELAGVDSQARAELRVLPGARAIHELF